MQKLLGVVRLRRDVRALSELQHRLLRGRPVAAGAGDQEPLVLRDQLALLQRVLDCAGQPGDVLAVQRRQRRDRARVARGVAPAPFDLRRADDHLVREVGLRALRLARDQPDGPVKAPRGLERQRSRALVADRDEEVRAARPQHELERLLGPAAGPRGVERGAAAGVEHAALREAPSGRYRAEPVRLGEDRAPGLLAVHGRSIAPRLLPRQAG